MLPEPVIELHDNIYVVRDDLIPGGTKRRALWVFLDHQHDEYVYASPVFGAAQVALAHTCREQGKRATIFCAKRKILAPLTVRAIEAGATIVEVPFGMLSNVTAKARAYCAEYGARLLPFGLDAPMFLLALADVAMKLPVQPTEVWSIASSGTLTRALQMAWPDATFYGVKVGHHPDAGKATIYTADEAFDQPARFPPPFPSMPEFDAKAWRIVKQHASPGALFWNVAA
jgi:hypothetical protein